MIDRSKLIKFEPDYAVPPGETVLETIAALGMTQAELALRAGRPLKTINEIIKGKQSITPETALQFERVLGLPASFWNNLEKNYREALVRIEETKNLETEVSWLNKIPVRDLIKNGWIKKYENRAAQLKEILSFMGVASPKELNIACPEVVFRQSTKAKGDPWAVCAWLRKGELDAQAVDCKPFNDSGFRTALAEIRKMTCEDVPSILDEWKKLCADNGVALVIIKELPRLKVNGATRWLKDKAVIQLSLFYKFVDIFWFSFFHEAGHILRHSKKKVFIENINIVDDLEKEADEFAANFLIPPNTYNTFIKSENFDSMSIKKFAKEIGVGECIVIGRLQHDRKIPFSIRKPRLCWQKNQV